MRTDSGTMSFSHLELNGETWSFSACELEKVVGVEGKGAVLEG